MAKTTTAFRCGECGWQTSKWVGRCGECQAWGTVEEVGGVKPRTQAVSPKGERAVPIGHINIEAAKARSTGVSELDRVLGGGLVPGAVVLLAGEPGIGKSTLLVEVAAQAARTHGRALYVTAEESAAQVHLRATRVGAVVDELFLVAETDLATILGHIEQVDPGVLIVDSVQTIASAEVDSQAGGVTQIREVATSVIRVAKERGMSTVLVGHVTKDGSIAGPRVLEHLVDVVLQIEGDRHTRLRLVRATKNRYGAADEVGCFDLTDTGIVGIDDPSGLFVSARGEPVDGTCLTMTMEGTRPLLAEVQALVASTQVPSPRRATSGLDNARVAMVLAVLERRGGVPLSARDVHAATVGGVRISEPAADLAIALAVAGASANRAMPAGCIAIGEVGLSGDVRRVQALARRLTEAARLGVTTAIVPPESGAAPAGMRLIEVSDIRVALAQLTTGSA